MTIDAANRGPNQYTASAGEKIFAYTFEIFSAADVRVYQTLDGQTPNPTIDLLTLGADYTVQNVGSDNGTITLIVGATALDTITIESAVIQDQTVNFKVGGKFSPDQVEFVIDKLTALIQENSADLSNRGLQYEVTDQLATSNKDNILPKLATKTTGKIPIWSKNESSQLIATEIDENADASTLRTDLANDGSGTDGARLVGYFNATTPASDKVNEALDDAYSKIDVLEKQQPFRRNILIGWDFEVNPFQRGVSFTAATTPNNNDSTYTADRTVLLSDGNDIVDLSVDTDRSLKLEVETIDKQFGIVQFIENRNMRHIAGGKVSLSIEIKSSFTSNIRVGILNWTGTEDAPTKDVVGTWAGVGTDPTLVADYSYANTPSDLATTASYQTFLIEDVTISSSSTNIAVFVWTDDTTIALSSTLNILNVKLEQGVKATAFSPRLFEEEIALCERYYEKSYNLSLPPGSIDSDGTSTGWLNVSDTEILNVTTKFSTRKISTPVVTWYSDISGVINTVNSIVGVQVAVTSQAREGQTATGYPLVAAAGGDRNITAHWTAEAELGV